MALIFLYFSLFLALHFLSKQFRRTGAARLFQLVACFILLFGFFGFRDITILNDTPHYYGSYYQLTKLRNYVESSVFVYRILIGFEYGYQVLQHILIKYISKEPYTIILVSSLIVTICNIRFWDKRTRNISLALFMMLLSGTYFEHYSLIRQSFALMIFYKAYEYLERDEWKRYTALILLAMLFHTSAFVLLILPLLQKIPVNKRYAMTVMGLAVLFALSVYELFAVFGLTDNVYFVMNKKREAFPLGAMLDGLLMLLLFIASIYMRGRDGIREISKTDFWICIFGLCVCIITPAFLSFFRLNVYIWPFVFALFFRHASRHPQILTALLILLSVRIALILAFRNEFYHLIPYSFYDWSDKFHYFNMYWNK